MMKRLAAPELVRRLLMPSTGSRGWRRGAIAVVALAVVLRLIYAWRVEPRPEEAYYWNYAQHLDIGYLDHPSMVGWLVAAGTAVLGDTEFGVRIGGLLWGGLRRVFIY